MNGKRTFAWSVLAAVPGYFAALAIGAFGIVVLSPSASATCTVNVGGTCNDGNCFANIASSCTNTGNCEVNVAFGTCNDGDCAVNAGLASCSFDGECLVNAVLASCNNGDCPVNVLASCSTGCAILGIPLLGCL